MTSPVDIRPDQLEIVQEILLKHLPAGVKIWVFGSRANWTTKDSSDLDLALEGESKLSHKMLGALKDAFDDSAFPYTVDVVDLNRIGDSFRKIVESQKVLLPVDGDGTTAGDWIQCTVAEACGSINYGFTASASSSSDGPKFLRITDIVSGSIDWNKVPHVEADDETVAKYRLHDGDIVIARTGASTGTSAYVSDPPQSVFASYLVRLQAKPEFDARFLAYYLKSKEFWDFIRGVLGDKSAQPNASASTMTAAPFRAPRDEAQQRAIAHILGTLDDKIELNRRMNETLEEMARALFKSWFVDFDPVRAKMDGRWRRGESLPGMPAELYDLFPDGMVSSELGEIPEGWEVSEIGREVDVVGGSTPSTKEPAFWEKGDIHWATPKDLSNLQSKVLLGTGRKITSAGLKKISSGLLPVGTVLMSSRAPVGYLAISQVSLAVNQGFIAMKCSKDISKGYTLFWCEENMDVIKANASGTTFAEISKKNFRPLSIIVPTSDVLKVFDDEVNPVMARVIANENESRSLVTLRDTLLPRLISGKLQVTQRRKRQHD